MSGVDLELRRAEGLAAELGCRSVVRWMTGCEVDAVASAGLGLTDEEGRLAGDDVDTAVGTLRLADGSLAIVEAFRKSPHGYIAEAEVTTEATVDGTLPRSRRAGDWMEWFAEAGRRSKDS